MRIVAVGYATFVADESVLMSWGLFEDDGAVAVQQHSVFGVPLDGLG